MIRRVVLFFALLFFAVPAVAQTRAPEPPLRRWLDVQSLTLNARYRFIKSNAGVVSSNDLQYKESLRARFNADARKRYTANIGVVSGSSFIGSWDNTGLGIKAGDYHSHYVRQLYISAAPVAGLEMQAGGLYIVRGESTEFTTYDDDGYVVGERVSVRRPKGLYLDELSVTRGALGGPDKNGVYGVDSAPNLFDRWDGFNRQQYTHVLATKRFSPTVAGSFDYTRSSGADTLHAAVALRFKATAPISALRYEQYRRTNKFPAAGFAITAERPITKWVRLQAGYITIDERFGNLNSDRIQRGRRFFAVAAVPIHGPLSATVVANRALGAPYALSNRIRFDVVLQYDLLATLRGTGKI